LKWPYIAFVARRVRSSLWELAWTHALTSGTMAMTLFVFGVFLLLQENLRSLLGGWGEKIQIHAYLERNVGVADAEASLSRVRGVPEVASIRFTSQEQAWKDFREALGTQSGVLEGLPADLLPASLEVAIRPEFRDSAVVETLATRLRAERGIAVVEYPQAWADRLKLVILAVEWGKWVFGGVLFFATFFIAGSTVRLALMTRKDEIEIMQLVGASEELIQAPFVCEGMVQGIAGAVLSIVGLWGLFVFLHREFSPSLAFFGPASGLKFLQLNSIALLVALGCFLGTAGSLFSLRRFRKAWRG
jgi:cell division transport system permease protein